jgi:hypothetical protein
MKKILYDISLAVNGFCVASLFAMNICTESLIYYLLATLTMLYILIYKNGRN